MRCVSFSFMVRRHLALPKNNKNTLVICDIILLCSYYGNLNYTTNFVTNFDFKASNMETALKPI
jgi:hypothetical protein